MLTKANKIYDEFKREAPDIGGGKNMLAGNLDMALAFFAFHEASDKRVTGKDVEEIAGWMFSKLSFASKLIDFNKPWVAKLMYKVYVPYVKKVEKYKAKGEWGNTWGVKLNPENYSEGCSFHLIGCPLVDFAKKHGYMEMMPYMCATDHMSANLMNAKLLRNHTVAEGADSCDYWYVGNRSKATK
ncbi:MAG: L-2-amino-thiazoline-4-carboxylic acid hydrolase [Lachnospiraceae bacterium]|nr:L-2-amino-thiazoline-4-carboxylic acid hydrolase [Lachnospiraceae bacterium]